jgi:phosphatidylserine/phosphatidylglycerophosphate/cardiolipin synthase-like enzyme
MSPKRSSSKSSLGTILVLILILGFGAYYTLAGSDPLGLFESATPTTMVSVPQATRTPKPTKPATQPATQPAKVPTQTPVVITSPASGSWWQVYFVNPQKISDTIANKYSIDGLPPEMMKGSITEKLIQHIDAAKTTIHIASFETDLNDVANALIRAKGRGVDVRWITDDESGITADKKPGHGQFAMLKKAGIEVIDDKRGALMHDKFWLFDGKTVWTGSTNITISGMFEQDNNVIVIDSPELTAIYESQFEDMWSGKFNAKSPSTVNQQKLTIDGTNIQILFSPEDKAISQIIPYIQAAKKSVRFMAFTYTQEQLGQAMLAAMKSGVEVTGVFESTGSDSQYSQMTPLFCAKAPVRQDGNPSFLHHKVIIIDERIVITGSLNFTDNADQSNNENVIIIDNAGIAKLYTAEFQRVWAVGHDPEPGKLVCK